MKQWLRHLGLANRARKIVTGQDNILNKIRKGLVSMVIVAEDASDNTKKLFRDKCRYYDIIYVEQGTIQEISQAIGKNNRVAVGVCDDGFTKGLLAKITK